MDRRYKQIIERDEMTPVSELSSAFSRTQPDLHDVCLIPVSSSRGVYC